MVTKLQEGKQREGGARKDVARPSSEPALEPRFPSWESSGVPKPRFPVGSCFRCGDPGRFERECPKMVGPSVARLEYPLINKIEHVVIESMECVDGGNE